MALPAPRKRRVFESPGSRGALDLSPEHVPLTVKLRGRPEAPVQAPRAHNLSRARGADIQTVHGPLQRLLDGITTGARAEPYHHQYPNRVMRESCIQNLSPNLNARAAQIIAPARQPKIM